MTDSEYRELVDFLGRQFTAIDRRFDAVDRRFDVIDEKFREVFGHFDATYRRLETLENVALLPARIQELERRLQG